MAETSTENTNTNKIVVMSQQAKEIVQAVMALSTYGGLFGQLFTGMEITTWYYALVLGWSAVYGWKAIKAIGK